MKSMGRKTRNDKKGKEDEKEGRRIEMEEDRRMTELPQIEINGNQIDIVNIPILG